MFGGGAIDANGEYFGVVGQQLRGFGNRMAVVQVLAVGAAVIEAGLAQIRSWGALGCILTGNPVYYRRFGFELAGRPVRLRDDAEEASETRLAFLSEVPGDPTPGHLEGRLRFGICLREEICEAISHDFEAELN